MIEKPFEITEADKARFFDFMVKHASEIKFHLTTGSCNWVYNDSRNPHMFVHSIQGQMEEEYDFKDTHGAAS